jgi:sugar phosphate isomerase/epimerase
MTMNLVCGAIGVEAGQLEAIRLAHRHGFESVEAFPPYLATLSDSAVQALLEDLRAKGLAFGAAGLPVEFRRDDAAMATGMKELPRLADGLQRAGVTRVGTWLMPGDRELTYLRNFKRHVTRLGAIATILKDHGLRLGLEYVGTRTSRARQAFPFVRNLAETLELIAEIGTGNIGVVLDSWHWWQAGDTVQSILLLRPEQVVAVDLNDAPAGVEIDRQLDNQRELPMATGVIDVRAFLNALVSIGYDGPVRAEPFNKALNAMGNDDACAATIRALRKAMAQIG